MSRGAAILLAAAAALVAGCDRPRNLGSPPFVPSATTVLMDVTGDDAPPYLLWLVPTGEGRTPDASQVAVTVRGEGDWLAAELEPAWKDPYGIRLRPKPGAFRVPGTYTSVVDLRPAGSATTSVEVYLHVEPPALQADAGEVRFQVAPGGAAPAPRTVLVSAVGGASGIPLPDPTVAFYDQTCGEWVDAAVSTIGRGWAVTLTPVASALAALPAGTTCSVTAGVGISFDPYPGGGSRWGASTTIHAALAVQDPATELAEVSRTFLSWSTLAGDWNTLATTVAVTNGAGGDLTRPAISTSAPWLRASLSATRPYVLTVAPAAVGLAPGSYSGTVTVGAPGAPASTEVHVGLEVAAWQRQTWTMPALGATVTELEEPGGARMIVAGGTAGTGDPGPGFVRCDPLPCGGAAQGYGKLLTPRAFHTTTLYAPRHLIAAGGVDPATGTPVGTWEIDDDQHAHTWYVARPLVTPRFGHTATLLEDGRVLVAGGAIGSEASPVSIPDAEILDPAEPDPTNDVHVTHSWNAFSTRIAPMNLPRNRASAVRLRTGEVLVAGGEHARGAATITAELYDPRTGRWNVAPDMNEPRADAVLVLLGDGRVLAAGGTNGQRALATAEIYDPESRTWTYTGSLHLGRVAPGVQLPDGSVLLVGGMVGDTSAPGVTETVERFFPATGAWSWAAPLKEPRAGHAVTLLQGRLVVVAGGTMFLPWNPSTLVSDVVVGYGVTP